MDIRKYNHNKFSHEIKRRKWRKYLTSIPIESRSDIISRRLAKNVKDGRITSVNAPRSLSIIENPNEVVSFFNFIEYLLKKGNKLYLNIKDIKILSQESIMYFLSLIKNLKFQGIPFDISGNIPTEAANYNILKRTGFFNFVTTHSIILSKKGDDFQIIEGEKIDNTAVKKVCDFIITKYNLSKKHTTFIYEMLIELMTNTIQHAYFKKSHRINFWYLFLNFRKEDECIQITFLDNGSGIPKTVNKTMNDQIKTFISQSGLLFFGDSDLIDATLSGKFKSRTKMHYRGKGLPMINSLLIQNKISNCIIVSNSGYFSKIKKFDLDSSLHGTLFYWEISRRSFS
jgi:hypothetical protein